MRLALHSLLAALVGLLASLPARAQTNLVGVTYDGFTISINPANGNGAPIKQNGVLGLNAMAIDPQGRMLAAKAPGFTGVAATAWNVEPILGGVTFAFFPFLNNISGMAYSSAGVLYAVDGGPTGYESLLYVLDLSQINVFAEASPVSIAYVRIGNLSTTLTDLAFAPDGTLYGWDASWGLLTIDPANGHAIDVDGALQGGPSIGAIAFAPDGTLYGASTNLYTIDRTSGAVSLVGGPILTGNVTGMEFLPDAPHIYCTSKVNPLNCAPHISYQGVPSASAGSGFVLTADNFINRKVGGFGFSVAGPASVTWGNGYMCEIAPLRSPQLFTGGNALPAVDCSGVLTFDFNTFVSLAAPSGVLAGTTVCGQFLCRDPLDPVRLDMSNAITFTMKP